jgi:hypothetical protein
MEPHQPAGLSAGKLTARTGNLVLGTTGDHNALENS